VGEKPFEGFVPIEVCPPGLLHIDYKALLLKGLSIKKEKAVPKPQSPTLEAGVAAFAD
jgi:hypothetical protein